jgi:hypothetical protein
MINFMVRRPEGKKPLGRSILRWKDNNKMDLRKIKWSDMNWIDLARDRAS